MAKGHVGIDTAAPERFNLRRYLPIGCWGPGEAAQIVKADLWRGQAGQSRGSLGVKVAQETVAQTAIGQRA